MSSYLETLKEIEVLRQKTFEPLKFKEKLEVFTKMVALAKGDGSLKENLVYQLYKTLPILTGGPDDTVFPDCFLMLLKKLHKHSIRNLQVHKAIDDVLYDLFEYIGPCQGGDNVPESYAELLQPICDIYNDESCLNRLKFQERKVYGCFVGLGDGLGIGTGRCPRSCRECRSDDMCGRATYREPSICENDCGVIRKRAGMNLPLGWHMVEMSLETSFHGERERKIVTFIRSPVEVCVGEIFDLFELPDPCIKHVIWVYDQVDSECFCALRTMYHSFKDLLSTKGDASWMENIRPNDDEDFGIESPKDLKHLPEFNKFFGITLDIKMLME